MDFQYSDSVKLNNAFAELQQQGWFAQGNYYCCSSCAWSRVPEGHAGYVFWNAQSQDASFGQPIKNYVLLRGSTEWIEEDLEWDDEYFNDNVKTVESVYGDTLVSDLYLQWSGPLDALVSALEKYELDIVAPSSKKDALRVVAASG